MSKPRVPPRHRKGRNRLAAVPPGFSGFSAEAGRVGAQSPMPTDQGREIQDLIDLMKRNNLAELEIEREGFRIRVRRDTLAGVQPVSVRESAPGGRELQEDKPVSPASAEAAGYATITSPIVGTFYLSAAPDADPYVEEGDFVKKGQVLCIVEAMKLMNEIESEMDGRIVKILAESTTPVEYGQPLFLIDPKPAS